ncbi:MAG TPA: Dyp-type peroxidase [Pedobacter sp.]|uniref:Dyp-type peroxidase n=1 Tax=Pedobacter sp. TaxID=1411316 RepID=UPI002C0722D5|nr:Dyp-type peroxidase [Pedobacter sp.]HMI03707.1 Dyp-type peroxidase [Pedobacter sp.]
MERNSNVPRPLPVIEGVYQSGISDPRFPLLPSIQLENDEDYERYKGLVDKQGYLSIIKADVAANSTEELSVLLKLLSDMAYEEMTAKPSLKHVMPLDLARVPNSWRVTVTIAYGYSLFIDEDGNDRYGISFRKPKNLKVIPSFPGDDFKGRDRLSDILILIASDHPYINVATARFFAEYTNKKFAERVSRQIQNPVFIVKTVQQGFGRPDSREFLKFNDGIDNLRASIDLEKLVYVDEQCGEPDWCINGSYLVYKKIREMMPVWEAFAKPTQEAIIGREKDSSLPLSRQKAGEGNLTPVYPDPTDDKDGPLNAHIRKVQPRRPFPDLFGENDLNRRFLRRPYPFFDGVDTNGNSINGLHFVAFMKSIQDQFEHVTNMWQMNPNFPVPGTGIDALYAKEVLKSLDGGYYFCPPARHSQEDFIGSGLFSKGIKKPYEVPKNIYGYGITFVDIDETIFNTFASIKVLYNNEVIKSLNNQEFNTYKLRDGETFDFGEFRDAANFLATSKPIVDVISELKKILRTITANSEGSRIVFLTARSDFDDKEKFLNVFRKYGIDINSSRMYVERTGNITSGTVAEKKKQVVLSYLSNGTYRRVRLLDDNLENLTTFLSIKEGLKPELVELIRTNHTLSQDIDPVEFFAYLVDHNGKMSLFGKV